VGVQRRARVDDPRGAARRCNLLAEGERPIRLRGSYLDDDAIAERTVARRTDEWPADTSPRE
jgi:hypothetical protein